MRRTYHAKHHGNRTPGRHLWLLLRRFITERKLDISDTLHLGGEATSLAGRKQALTSAALLTVSEIRLPPFPLPSRLRFASEWSI